MSQDHLAIFSEKEREVIEKCVASGQYLSVTSALESAGFIEFTPEKEKALDAFLNTVRPVVQKESKVKEEMNKWLLAGNQIDTPEKEKYWQDKLDAEKAELRASMTKEDKEVEAKELAAKTLPEDDLAEVDMTKAEIMDALKAKGVEFKPQASKAELSALLEKHL